MALSTERGILADFPLTAEFTRVYGETLQYCLVPRTDGELQDIRNRAAGALWAEVAMNYIASLVKQPQKLLSPADTVDFFQSLYPDAKKVNNLLEVVSLKGVSVSDGLVIEPVGSDGTRVVSIYEATLSRDEENFRRHYVGFKIQRKKYPGIFGNARLIFLTPRETHLSSSLMEDKAVDIMELPATRRKFGQFIKRFYESYRRSEDDPTLLEVQERVRYQLKRSQNSGFFIGKSG